MSLDVTSPDLLQRMTLLEDRLAGVRVLEDKMAILELHSTYLNHVDKGWGSKKIELDSLRDVFADDVVWGSTPESFPEAVAAESTLYEGVDNVIAMLDKSTAVFEFCMHNFSNPTLTVDGDRAVGAMNITVGTRQDGIDNVWFLRAHTKYVRTSHGWRVQQIALDFASTLRPISAH